MAFTLTRFQLSDLASLSAQLSACTADAGTMEAAAECVVGRLRASFLDPATGTPEVVLARCFQTVAPEALPEDLPPHAGVGSPVPLDQQPRHLTLLGTVGDGADWCDRRQSASRQVIALPSTQAEARTPMVAALVEHLLMRLHEIPGATSSVQPVDTVEDFDLFFVPEAAGDSRVPDQEFVREHGVRSVLGFGAVLPGPEVFAVVLFTRVPVTAEVAALFRTLAVATKLALLPTTTKPLFAGGPVRSALSAQVDRARMDALEQMLAVQQQTMADQAARLEQSLQRAEEQRVRAELEAETTDTLRQIGTTLAANLDLQQVVQSATDAATHVTGAAFGAFFYNVTNPRGESYMLYTLAGAPREAFEKFPMPRNTAVFEPTFRGSSVLRSDDITRDPRYGHNAPHHGPPSGHLPVHSYLAVPVVSRNGTVHGGLFFGHPDTGVFDQRAERLAVGIAAQTAIALDNAQLYEQQRGVAVELQRSLLPQELPATDGLEVAHEYRPGSGGADVGGDWFDVIPLNQGRLAFVIGDAMGRGLYAAAIMGQLRTAVRAYAAIDTPPGKLLRRLSRLVREMGEDLIATCAYAVFDPATQTLTLANAGHLPAALMTDDGDVRLLDYHLGPLLGVPDTDYREQSIGFPPGHRLLLFTDGLVEHRGRHLDEGLHALHRWLESAHGPLDELCRNVTGALLDRSTQDDDVTVLAIANTQAKGRPII